MSSFLKLPTELTRVLHNEMKALEVIWTQKETLQFGLPLHLSFDLSSKQICMKKEHKFFIESSVLASIGFSEPHRE